MNLNRLRGIMAEQRVTQKDLAKSIGIAENTLLNKLNGRNSFNTREAIAICDVLHISDPKDKVDIFLSSPSQ